MVIIDTYNSKTGTRKGGSKMAAYRDPKSKRERKSNIENKKRWGGEEGEGRGKFT